MPHIEGSLAILAEIGAEHELGLACASYGRLKNWQGRSAEARDYLTRAVEIFERLGTLTDSDRVRQELAGLPDSAEQRAATS